MNIERENEQRRQHFIREHSEKAQPGNSHWRAVESLQGEDGDFTVWDYGTEPYQVTE